MTDNIVYFVLITVIPSHEAIWNLAVLPAQNQFPSKAVRWEGSLQLCWKCDLGAMVGMDGAPHGCQLRAGPCTSLHTVVHADKRLFTPWPCLRKYCSRCGGTAKASVRGQSEDISEAREPVYVRRELR